jgi:hypothetical protein
VTLDPRCIHALFKKEFFLVVDMNPFRLRRHTLQQPVLFVAIVEAHVSIPIQLGVALGRESRI